MNKDYGALSHTPFTRGPTHLVAGVIADHVALATVDAHVVINNSHYLVCVVQLSIGPDPGQGTAYHVLGGEGGGIRRWRVGRRRNSQYTQPLTWTEGTGLLSCSAGRCEAGENSLLGSMVAL